MIELGEFAHRSTSVIDGSVQAYRHVFRVPVRVSDEVLTHRDASSSNIAIFSVEGIAQPRAFGVSWTRESALVAAPDQIVLNAGKLEQQVVVRAARGTNIRIRKASFIAEVSPVAVVCDNSNVSRSSHLLSVSVNRAAVTAANSEGNTELRIEIDHPGSEEVLNIPVSWRL